MSHADEGALHAYLDGALDEYPTAEARRIREHLQACAPCAERLETERKIREEARGILGAAAPDIEIPSLEDLRARVRAIGSRGSVFGRLQRLGWAASVVLAIGAGWLLRGGHGVQSPTASSVGSGGAEARSPEAEAAEMARGTGAGRGVAVAPGSRTGEAETTAAEPREAPTTAPTDALAASSRARASEDPRGSDVSLRASSDRTVDASAATSAGGAPSKILDGSVAAGLPAPQVRMPTPLALPPVSAVVPQRVAERDVVIDTTRGGDGDANHARPSTQGQVLTSAFSTDPDVGARGRDGDKAADRRGKVDSGSLVVPGLELIALLPVSEGSTFAGMRALQRLENGDTLEVVHLAQGVAPSTLGPLRAGSREIVLERGGGWIVLRAPRTQAELRALLQRLEDGS
jgi:hypothetical protein